MAVKTEKGRATLRDRQQALEVAAGTLPNRIVVYGESDFLRMEAVERVRQAWLARFPGGDMAIMRGAGENKPVLLTDLTAELTGGSLFAKEKLVILRQGERVLFPQGGKNGGEGIATGGEREKSFLEQLEKLSRTTWVLMESSQLPGNRTLGKKLAELCHLVHCPQPNQRETPGWLIARARTLQKRLDADAVDLLVRAYGTDLGALAGELDKLALFANEEQDITSGMASQFLIGAIEFDFFGFTNAIEAKDRKLAMFYARRIAIQGTRDQRGKRENSESSAHRVLGILAGTVQGLLKARVAVATGLDSNEFAAAEKISPWRANKLMEASSRFSLRELRSMTGGLAEYTRQIHDTGGDPLLTLERIAVEFTGGM